MEEKSKVNFEVFCREVMYLNQKIRFAAVLDKNGKRIGGGYREKVESYLTPNEVQMSLYYAKKRWDNRGNLSHRLGDAKYSVTEYEKVKQITIPVGNNLLLISTEIDADHIKILEKLRSLIDDHFRGLLLKR